MAPRERIGQREPTYVARAYRDYKVLLVPPEPDQSSSKRFLLSARGNKKIQREGNVGKSWNFFPFRCPFVTIAERGRERERESS